MHRNHSNLLQTAYNCRIVANTRQEAPVVQHVSREAKPGPNGSYLTPAVTICRLARFVGSQHAVYQNQQK